MACSGPLRVITGVDKLRYQKLSSQVVTWRKNKYSADFREEPVLSERTVQLSPSLETPKIQKTALPFVHRPAIQHALGLSLPSLDPIAPLLDHSGLALVFCHPLVCVALAAATTLPSKVSDRRSRDWPRHPCLCVCLFPSPFCPCNLSLERCPRVQTSLALQASKVIVPTQRQAPFSPRGAQSLVSVTMLHWNRLHDLRLATRHEAIPSECTSHQRESFPSTLVMSTTRITLLIRERHCVQSFVHDGACQTFRNLQMVTHVGQVSVRPHTLWAKSLDLRHNHRMSGC